MILQDALKELMKLSIEDVAKKHLYRKWGCCPWIKFTIDMFNSSGLVIYDEEDAEKFFKNQLNGVHLRLDEILADDWFIRDDDWKEEDNGTK